MKLKELLHGLDVLELHADEDLDITGVQYDSRQVTSGDLFVAISGFQTDGHRYIPKAMENGAVCVVCEKKPETDIPYVLVSDARSALAALGANWFGHPADAMCVVGITGTNGKTTTTYMIKAIAEKAGYKVTYARNYTDVDDKIIARANRVDIAVELLYASVLQLPVEISEQHGFVYK